MIVDDPLACGGPSASVGMQPASERCRSLWYKPFNDFFTIGRMINARP